LIPNETVAFAASFVAMLLIATSYFLPTKDLFLILQSLGIVGLMVSYLFSAEYFALVGLGVGLFRTLAYYAYEKRAQIAPLWLTGVIVALTVGAYLVVNLGIQKTAKPVDILYLISLVLFAVIFRMRSLERMRYFSLFPIAFAILYNAFSGAAVFAVASYSFELGANCLAIIKTLIIQEKENTNEKS
jgi:hypothetical protein